MKTTAICPKCDGRKIYGVSPVRQTFCDAQGTLRTFHLAGAALPTGNKSLFGGEETSIEVAGPLDACVCAGCGYTEWYMPSRAVQMLERMLATGDVTVVRPTVAPAPFR